MKKIFLTMLVVAFFFGSVYSQSITVLSPNGGENLKIGQKYFIKWKSSGIIGSSVGIKLFFKGSGLGYIKQNVPNSGVYSWTIDSIIGYGKIKPGVKYQIQVKKSGVTGDLSNGFFTISDSSSKPSITILEPNQGTVWEAGKECIIRWKTSGIKSSKMLLVIFFKNRTNPFDKHVFLYALNSGYYKIPSCENIAIKLGGGKFYMRIYYYITLKTVVYGESQPFTIKEKPAFAHFVALDAVQKKFADDQETMKKFTENLLKYSLASKIEIIAPKAGDVISPKKDVWIIWKNIYQKYKYVTILIYDSNNYSTSITNRTNNTGRFLWKVSSSYLRPSNRPYLIRIFAFNSLGADYKKNHVSSKTGYFYIK